MAAKCSHQDPERRYVSASAHGVAALRGHEAVHHPEDYLFEDPYAAALGGKVGEAWIRGAVDAYFKSKPDLDSEDNRIEYRGRLHNVLAIRTHHIDHAIQNILQSHPEVAQICVLGAGLDTRPWRLNMLRNTTSAITYFEVDFPEIFEFKLSALAELGASVGAGIDYRPVEVDLSLPSWPDTLIASGYQPNAPTLWLMEGLTMYLTEPEMNVLASHVATLSPGTGSHILLDVFATKYGGLRNYAVRFRHDDIAAYLKKYGWVGSFADYQEIGAALGRSNASASAGYFFYSGVKDIATSAIAHNLSSPSATAPSTEAAASGTSGDDEAGNESLRL